MALGLAEHVATFKSRNVNIEQARQLSEADLKTMGLNMGARLRLKEALGPAGQKKSQ